ATTLLVRLGRDTMAVEQYTRTPGRMEGTVVSRTPVTTVQRYAVELGADDAPVRMEYSVRRADGSPPVAGAIHALTLRFSGDSIHLTGRRGSGDTSRATLAKGMLLPFVNNSYGLYELGLARLRNAGRDSGVFSLVPMNIGVRTLSPLPVRLFGDSARFTWFGAPLYARHDGRGNLLGLDGTRTAVKVRVERVPALDVDALTRRWAARDQRSLPSSPR
ncbi:MAG: hypothetical protein H0W68_13675, partial [Gemmatimonadaceae bacterium]|nr:hypothetical protein [Gemmatimonadaceae bacterium]